MNYFLETTHLSEIIEESNSKTVIIFKYSNNCGSSERLYKELKQKIKEKVLNDPIYLVTVQTQPALSKKIAEMFGVKHQSPQILILNKGKLVYTAHHYAIKTKDFVFT